MNQKEILKNIKELVGLAKQEEANEIDTVEEVVLSEEEVIEEPKAEVAELEEEPTEEPKEEPVEEAPSYATKAEMAELKQELLSMIKAMMEDKSDYSEADVPAELSKQEEVSEEQSEEVELSEIKEEIVHSPENKTEQRVNSFINKRPMTTAERVAWMINN